MIVSVDVLQCRLLIVFMLTTIRPSFAANGCLHLLSFAHS
jgi:hypothetical protein